MKVDKNWVPAGWFLLPNKEYETYNAVLVFFKHVKDVAAPNLVHIDFEAGEHKAFGAVYPATAVVGYWVLGW